MYSGRTDGADRAAPSPPETSIRPASGILRNAFFPLRSGSTGPSPENRLIFVQGFPLYIVYSTCFFAPQQVVRTDVLLQTARKQPENARFCAATSKNKQKSGKSHQNLPVLEQPASNRRRSNGASRPRARWFFATKEQKNTEYRKPIPCVGPSD